MKYILAILLAACVAFPARADEPAEVDARPIEIDGEPFVAFDRASAQKLLEMRMKFSIMELKLEKTATLLTGLNKENRLLSDNLDLADDKVKILTTENVDLKDTIRSLDSWWRDPWLWFGIGVVVGTGVTVAVVYAVRP